jgi:thioredoxin-dependent peroxiredoxin
MIKIGKKAPDFVLPATDGKICSLIDFAGKKLILYFYPKDNTSGCTKEACSFENNRMVLKKKGAVVVGVSADSIASHEKFAQKHGLTFSLLSDEKKKIIKAYGVWKEKSMYGKKYFGIERTTIVIDENGFVRHIFRKVKVDGHTEEVLALL